jgi:tetratricopeptide (TPR) repeat protein
VPVDVDGDGDLDLALQSLQGLRLMENTAPRRHYARLRLRATKTHPLALNAVARVTAGGVTQQAYVTITDGFMGQVPADLHFGLASTSKIDAIRVSWPSGETQEWTDVPADLIVHLVEGEKAFTTEPLKSWPEESRPRVDSAYSYELKAQTVEGEEKPLAWKGKTTVVNFWGVSCAPCKEELPGLASLAKTYDRRVQFVGVSVENGDPAAVKATIGAFGLAYPQFLANDRVLESFYGKGGAAIIPSTFVFDPEGRLRRVFRRAVTEGELAGLLDTFEDEDTSALAWEHLANEHWKRRNLPQAISAVEKAIAIRTRAVTWHAYGLYLASSDRAEDAIVAYRKALEMDANYVEVHYSLAVCLHSTGKAKESLVHYQSAWDRKKDEGDYLILYGSAAAEALELEKANTLLTQALVVMPASPRALCAKGKLHMFLRQEGEARRLFKLALDIDPESKEAKHWLGKLDAGTPK